MTLTVRDFDPADADATADVMRVAEPHRVTNPLVAPWQVANAPAALRNRLLVAVLDGSIAGFARMWIMGGATPRRVQINLAVDPARRGRGAGSALLTAAEQYAAELGAATAYALVVDDEASVAFAARRGYERGRSTRFQRLDLVAARLPALQPPPAGVEIRTAADLADDLRPLYEADVEASADTPGHTDLEPPAYEAWQAMYMDRPDLRRGLTTVAMVDGAVAAFATARSDGRSRYWSGMTGTRRAFRGRGLAKLVKNDSLHRARAAGYTEAFTSNDADNQPMLAINSWFGYQPFVTEWRYVRDLAGPAAG